MYQVVFLFLILSTHSLLTRQPNQISGVPAKRKLLSLPDPVDNSFFLGQIQDTHSTMNTIKNQDRRQAFLRDVSNQFGLISTKLDSFRNEMFKKISILHMSLERPKVAMSSSGPIRMAPIANPLVSSNKFVNSISKEYEMTDAIRPQAYVSMDNNMKTKGPNDPVQPANAKSLGIEQNGFQNTLGNLKTR